MDDAAAAEHAEEYLEQVEEAEALAAILERDFAVRSRATGRELRDLDVLRSDPRQPGDLVFQVAVEVEIPFEAGLRVALPDSTAAAGPSSAAEPGGGGGPTGLRVEHLPKVQLLMVLPPAYPAAAAPHAVVHCAWLGRGEKERVNAELARQCDENAAAGGGPMGFFLADWLKNELLAFLGVADRGELRLGPPEGVAPGVQRKVVAKTAAKLAAHDEAMRERAFNRGTHVCPICFEPKAGLASLRLACSHAFCRACLRQHAEVNVREGSLGAIRCPDTACRVALGPADLRKVLPAEAFERWETLTLERSLDQVSTGGRRAGRSGGLTEKKKMEDVQYCPRCTAVCVRDPEEEAALCGTCFYSFCTLCLGARHPGTECLNAEQKLEILRNRTKNHREVQAEVLRKKRELEADIAAQKYVRLNCKTCPKCRNAIEKVSPPPAPRPGPRPGADGGEP